MMLPPSSFPFLHPNDMGADQKGSINEYSPPGAPGGEFAVSAAHYAGAISSFVWRQGYAVGLISSTSMDLTSSGSPV
jgi:hypothetical protein